ncbi:MAG: hypothetical protein AAGI23_08990 [Bacteroidota bacterium]
MKKVVQFAALGLMLVFFPLGSWYYLRMGYNERKGALDELKYEIPLTNFQLLDQTGKVIQKSDLEGGYSVIGTVDEFDANDPIIQASEGLFDEFATSKKMTLITHVESYDSLAIVNYLNQINQDSISSEWHFVRGVAPFAAVFEEQPENYLALVDTSGVVRNYYNAADGKEVGDMAKHIAMFVMPLLRDAELVFKRKEEK